MSELATSFGVSLISQFSPLFSEPNIRPDDPEISPLSPSNTMSFYFSDTKLSISIQLFHLQITKHIPPQPHDL